MPTNDEQGVKILGVLALMGLTWFAYQSMEDQDKRRHFNAALQRGLAEKGIGLVDAEVARLGGARRAWRVTVNHPFQGIWQERVEVPAGESYTSPHALSAILERFGATAA